ELPLGLEEKMLQDLNHILSTFEVISVVEKPPESGVEQSAFLRADQPLPYTDASRLFDPSRLKNGFLRVKPVLEDKEEEG
ncbi:MAG TPA: glutamyl-tRNA amidotransferase, partial [Coprothermobacter proteolyticus]|nr:glutamyl-tRNA amidotransferase [Coprothermobacter proteolyticus]